MNKLLQRWQALAAREQWLAYGVALGLLAALYLLLLGEPLSARRHALETERQGAEARRLAAQA
ncbi:MAG: type II secretion system protein GspM, partial [Pseudomonas sp.]